MTTQDASRLASLGWDAAWMTAFQSAVASSAIRAADSISPARVVAEHRERYIVALEDGDAAAVLGGRARHHVDSREALPAVGDWVGVLRTGSDDTAVIRFVVPRRGAFVRKRAGETTAAQVVAANADVALLAMALPGDANTRRLERYLTLAWESGSTPLVVLTKCDLAQDVESAVAEAALAAPGVAVVAVSAVTGAGIDDLGAHLQPGRTAVLLGSSGVGKSTLVNYLLGADRQPTAAVRDDGKGRHTTTHRELVRLASGALLIDTPGMRELQLWTADGGLDTAFSDVTVFADRCRFRDCAHETEPGCAVRDAVAAGLLSRERLEHWFALRRELAYLARKQDERASAEQRGRVKSLTRELRARLREKYE